MSTINRSGNFEPKSSILAVWVKPYPLTDPTLFDPTNSVALVDGEWLTLDTNGQKAARASTIGSVGNEATKRSFPLWAEKGRYDIQAQAERKVPLIYMQHWEADTRVFDAAVSVGSGAAITFYGQGLKVATITIGSRNYTGLVGHGGSGDTSLVVGYVSKLPAVNGGKLRLRGGLH